MTKVAAVQEVEVERELMLSGNVSEEYLHPVTKEINLKRQKSK